MGSSEKARIIFLFLFLPASYSMSSLKEMRDELRKMRKESIKPVSKMRKGDISAEIQKMREMREETAPVASTKGAPARKSMAAAESVKKAREAEFPVKPSKAAVKMEKPTRGASGKKEVEAPRMSKAVLRRMVEELTSDEE